MAWSGIVVLSLLAFNPTAPISPVAATLGPDSFSGRFVGDKLSIECTARTPQDYSGTIQFGARHFSFTARPDGDRLKGSFQSDGYSFEFSAELTGDALTLESGGATYRMRRVTVPATMPSSRPASPAGLLLRRAQVLDPMTNVDAATLLAPDGWKCGIQVLWRPNPFDPATISGCVSDPTTPAALWVYPRLSFMDPGKPAAMPNGSSYMGSEVRARFSTPSEFVLHYLVPRYRTDIVDPQTVFETDLPELAQDQRLKFQNVPGVQVKSSRLRISYRASGNLIEEDFICTIGSVPVNGKMTAWGAECESYRAAQGRLDKTMPLLRTIASSLRIELGWYNCVTQVGQMMQQDPQTSSSSPAALAHCIGRTSNQMSDAVRKSYDARAQIAEKCNDDLNALVPGVTVYSDRADKHAIVLPAGYIRVFSDPDGKIVLSNDSGAGTARLPEGWREMFRVAH